MSDEQRLMQLAQPCHAVRRSSAGRSAASSLRAAALGAVRSRTGAAEQHAAVRTGLAARPNVSIAALRPQLQHDYRNC
jgi:hypothetical protein